jgi:hypothetical protein
MPARLLSGDAGGAPVGGRCRRRDVVLQRFVARQHQHQAEQEAEGDDDEADHEHQVHGRDEELARRASPRHHHHREA